MSERFKYTEYIYHRTTTPFESTYMELEYVDEDTDEVVSQLRCSIVYKTAIISDVLTLPKARNHGLATKLLKQAIEYCKGNTIFLDCYARNAIALNMYLKLGFVIHSTSGKMAMTLHRMKYQPEK